MKRFLLSAVLVVAGLAIVATPASADTFNFTCVSNNSGVCPTLSPQLTVVVTDLGSGQVSFQFVNAGPVASSIADIYIGFIGSDPGLVAGFTATTFTSTGVSFVTPASPGSLPGGNTINFSTSPCIPASKTCSMSADSTSPTAPNGINPGENLTLIVQLASGFTFQDVINSMNAGGMAVGIHVQAIGTTGDSDALINCTPGTCTPVPEPGTLLLFGSGLLGLAGVIRRKLVG